MRARSAGGSTAAYPRENEKVRTHPAVVAATPRWMVWSAAGITWLQALATAGAFVLIGVLVDGMADGDDLAGGAVTWAVVLLAVAAALAGLGVWLAQWAGAQTERRLRADVVRGAYALGATNPQSGARLSLATEAVERAAHYRAGFLGPIVAALSAPLLVLALMAVTVDAPIAGWLALLLLVVPLLIGGF